MGTLTSRIRSIFAVVLGVLLWGAAVPATSPPPATDDLTAPLHRQMTEAERGLIDGEKQIAESRFRSALLEGWMLLGAIEAAEGHPEEARRAFERAAAASAETRRAHISLALLHLKLGEVDEVGS